MPTAALSWSAKTHKIFILRIVKKLEAYGLVETVRGPQGGIKLLKAGDQITLADVYLATQEVERVYKIHETNDRCQIGNNVSDVLADVQEDLDMILLAAMSKRTIADITNDTLDTSEVKIAKGAEYTNYKADQAKSEVK